MLKTHLDAVEETLLATSRIPANAGHTLHRGTPREAFIKEFLVSHLASSLAVGTGEIIDSKSLPREKRNQHDIVIYKANYPRIDLGGGVNAFLAESVVATIEVKSVLNREELGKAVKSARNTKNLIQNFHTVFVAGHLPPNILSYVVAYDAPQKATTVHHWLLEEERILNINQKRLPPTFNERISVKNEGIDGIFCLGKYSIVFDNSPMSFVTDDFRKIYPQSKRWVIEEGNGNLMILFLLLTQAGANLTAQFPEMGPYLKGVQIQNGYLWP